MKVQGFLLQCLSCSELCHFWIKLVAGPQPKQREIRDVCFQFVFLEITPVLKKGQNQPHFLHSGGWGSYSICLRLVHLQHRSPGKGRGAL